MVLRRLVAGDVLDAVTLDKSNAVQSCSLQKHVQRGMMAWEGPMVHNPGPLGCMLGGYPMTIDATVSAYKLWVTQTVQHHCTLCATIVIAAGELCNLAVGM